MRHAEPRIGNILETYDCGSILVKDIRMRRSEKTKPGFSDDPVWTWDARDRYSCIIFQDAVGQSAGSNWLKNGSNPARRAWRLPAE